MADESFKRKLAAILSADVEGYSRLMREDEEATVRTITTYRTVMTHLIQQYRGRVVDSPGDNILAEFTSVVDGVNCAVEIQRELAERNAELPENRRMQFRIGINLGDVLEEGKRIYGDGVNIAARMESLAKAGEIHISGTVYDAAESRIGLEYEFLGEHEVKNIDKPIRAYRILSYPGAAAHRVVKAKKEVGKTWRNVIFAVVAALIVGAGLSIWHFYFRPPPIEPASVDKMAYPLPDKPSIAVLPFDNLSSDPEQGYIADGISENIISTLSKIPNLFVIARNSTFTYKGKPVKIQKVSEDLGVRYILEGSVQKSGARIRITAQLIDAIKGHHLWSERYDRDLKEIFALQDEITMKIITEMQVKLTEGEQARILAKNTDNLKAYLMLVEGETYWARWNKEGNALAQRMFEEAIAIDPEYATAYFFLAKTHMMDYWFGSKSPYMSNLKAIELVEKALSIDDSLAGAHSLLGYLYNMTGQGLQKSMNELKRAITLAPNSAYAHLMYGTVLRYRGMLPGEHQFLKESILYLKKAIRLNPIPPGFYFHELGLAYKSTWQNEKAIEELKNAIKRSPANIFSHMGLVLIYDRLGSKKNARKAALEILKINPEFLIERDAKTFPSNWTTALRHAGLK